MKEIKEEDNKRLPLFNIYMIAAGVAVIIVGLILMYAGPDSEAFFEPDIFSVRRITVAPIVIFIGFISIIFAILCPKSKR